MMFLAYSRHYEENFPALIKTGQPLYKDLFYDLMSSQNRSYQTEKKFPHSQVEKVLNWHTMNACTQNQALKRLDTINKIVAQTSITNTKLDL